MLYIKGIPTLGTKLEVYKKKVIEYVHDKTRLPVFKIESLFIKWFFLAYIRGDVKKLIPTKSIINNNDLRYLTGKEQELSFNPNPKLIKYRVNKKITFEVTDKQFQRLTSLYTGKKFTQDVINLLYVYNILGGATNLASFPLGLFDMQKEQPTELFGSPLNTQYQYCSAFDFEKKLFKSNGSFFEYNLKPGFYVANPPFDEEIMRLMALRLIEQLKKEIKISVIIIIPAWTTFEAFNILKISKFYKKHIYLDRNKYKFYLFNLDKYLPLSNSYLILFQNWDSKVSLERIAKKWAKLVIGS